MSPSLPVAWFDLCLIPAHDRPASGDNVLVTRGALNTVVPSGTKNPQQGLILIGGPSRHYDWDENKLLAQIRRVVENSPTQWSMTDSARTPAQTRQALQTVSSKNLLYYPCSETPPGWVASRLVETAYVWVTEDSISMIYEALTSAAAVGVFDVPAKNNDRVVAAISQLAREGLVLRYDDWCNGEPLVPMKTPLHESARCARYVLDKFSPASVR